MQISTCIDSEGTLVERAATKALFLPIVAACVGSDVKAPTLQPLSYGESRCSSSTCSRGIRTIILGVNLGVPLTESGPKI